eukprot:8148876-Lingulodinium_polyedra.AAC.1
MSSPLLTSLLPSSCGFLSWAEEEAAAWLTAFALACTSCAAALSPSWSVSDSSSAGSGAVPGRPHMGLEEQCL